MNEQTINAGQSFVLLCPEVGNLMTAKEAFDACLKHARERSIQGITFELAELSGVSAGEYVAICGDFRDSIEVLPGHVIQQCEFGVDDLRAPVRRREYVRRLVKVLDTKSI